MTSLNEAKIQLSKLIEDVLAGKEVVISRAGKPVVKLVPYTADPAPRDLEQGIWAGQVMMAEDFDDLPADIMAAFTGEAL